MMIEKSSTYFKLPLAKREREKSGSSSKSNSSTLPNKNFIRNKECSNAFENNLKRVKEHLHYYEEGQEAHELPEWRENIGPTEIDILKTNHRFLRNEDENRDELTWEERVARKYYDGLYKEYCIVNLSKYKEGLTALRWRTKAEVINGKGESICGSTVCKKTRDLKPWEVNFGYFEKGVKMNTLVKVRLCPRCSRKLNYRKAKVSVSQEGN